MKTIKTTVYEFDELNDAAKEKARAWYREGALDYEWWESTYEDAASIGLKITEFDLDRNRHACGEFTEDAETVARAILANHGETCETFKTAKAFLAEFEAVSELATDEAEEKREELSEEFRKSLLEDYSIMLQNEMEYLLGDEQVDESIRANGYTFTETGKRYG